MAPNSEAESDVNPKLCAALSVFTTNTIGPKHSCFQEFTSAASTAITVGDAVLASGNSGFTIFIDANATDDPAAASTDLTLVEVISF